MHVKFLMGALALTFLPAIANASDKSDGCGLGWMVTKRTSLMATSTRATTNYFVPPTFGMTSGTLGCAQHSFVQKEIPAVEFMAANQESLSVEMAMGSGEYLHGFAKSLGCSDAAVGDLGRVSQDHYEMIFDAVDSSPIDSYKRFKAAAMQDAVLTAECKVLS